MPHRSAVPGRSRRRAARFFSEGLRPAKARAVLVWLLCLGAPAGAGEVRVALVIGNGAYVSVPRLDNPVRDAARVAEALRETGFQTVQVRSDLDREGLVQALRDFEKQVDGADWALVYYAGHGLEVGGTNYVVPVNAQLRSDRDVGEEAMPLDQILKRLEGARKLRIVILDACRDNPFLASMKRTLASRSVGVGLAPPDLQQLGTLVAFSAAAGQVASDGEGGQGNSPYAAALVRNLATPDLEVNLFFRRVRTDVLRTTRRGQEPATYESLSDDRFVFRQDRVAALPAEQPVTGAPPSRVAALPAAEPVAAAPPSRAALLAACDRLAASGLDRYRPSDVAGIAYGAIDTKAAVPACRVAVEAAPGERRMLFQLGRALNAERRIDEARVYYEQAAALGYPVAMTNLGGLADTAKDHRAARQWYEKAAALKDPTALYNLGVIHASGTGVPRDTNAARAWYAQAAALGNAEAMNALGGAIAAGWGVPADHEAARGWYERAAALGNANAMNNLGLVYRSGLGVATDYGLARAWYEKAAARGHAGAMLDLGWMANNGLGAPKDYDLSRDWYRKSAGLGNAVAVNNLGLAYLSGTGVAKDYRVAREWFEKGAALDNPASMNRLGLMYSSGWGVAKDYRVAYSWQEKCAALGNAACMLEVGWLHEYGYGVPKDYRIAYDWYSKAAAGGNAIAMSNLGLLFTYGRGVDRDYAAAHAWFEKAAALGNERAKRELATFKRRP